MTWHSYPSLFLIIHSRFISGEPEWRSSMVSEEKNSPAKWLLKPSPQLSFRSWQLDKLPPVFKLQLRVCVCMCEHSLHRWASELSAQKGAGVGGQRSAQRPTHWTPARKQTFFINLCFKITIDSKLFSVVNTQNAFYPAPNAFNIP